MYAEVAIKEVKKIHCGKRLARVMTVSQEERMNKDTSDKMKAFRKKFKEYFQSGILMEAGVQVMEVEMTRFNESKTGIVVTGLLLDDKGAPLYPEDPKKNKIEAEIPFNQRNVPVQPGTWFDEEKAALEYAAVLNKETKSTVADMVSILTEISEYQDILIKKGA